MRNVCGFCSYWSNCIFYRICGLVDNQISCSPYPKPIQSETIFTVFFVKKWFISKNNWDLDLQNWASQFVPWSRRAPQAGDGQEEDHAGGCHHQLFKGTNQRCGSCHPDPYRIRIRERVWIHTGENRIKKRQKVQGWRTNWLKISSVAIIFLLFCISFLKNFFF